MCIGEIFKESFRMKHVAKDAVLVLSLGGWPGVQRGGNAGTGLRVGAGNIAVAPRGP